MRHFPTSSPTRATLAALALAAVTAAQSPATRSAGPRTDGPVPLGRVDADTGETLRTWTPPAVDVTTWPGAGRPTATLPQEGEEEYSVTTLFNEMHGEFMQKGFTFRNNVAVWYGYQPDTGISGADGDYNFNDLRGEAFVPFAVDPDMLLIVGARLGQRSYQFDTTALGAADETVYEAAAHVGLGRFLSDELYVEAMFRPGVYSDMDGTLNRGDWQFFGDVIGTYQFDPGFYGKVGVIYDGTFDDLPAYPVLGFALLIDETFRIDMLLPKSFELSWIPDPSFILKGGLSLDGELYQVRSPAGTGKVPYDVRTQELRLYVDGTWRMSDQLSVFGRGGATLAGDYDWGEFSGATDVAPFFEIGAGLNF